MIIEQAIGWACLAGAVGAIGVYVWLIVRRVHAIRLATNLGLFFTGLALFQGPNILARTDGDVLVQMAVGALLVSVIIQMVAALRTRPVWSGEERRQVDTRGS